MFLLFVWFCLFFGCLFWVCLLFQGPENGCDDLTRRASCKVALAMIEYPNMTGRDCHGTTESTCLNSIAFVEKSVTSKPLQELHIHFLFARQQRCPPQFGSFC